MKKDLGVNVLEREDKKNIPFYYVIIDMYYGIDETDVVASVQSLEDAKTYADAYYEECDSECDLIVIKRVRGDDGKFRTEKDDNYSDKWWNPYTGELM